MTEDFPAPPPEISNVRYSQDSSGIVTGITSRPDVTRKTSETKGPTRVAHVQSLRIADEGSDAAGKKSKRQQRLHVRHTTRPQYTYIK
jgi:hypothetical protein